jgi:hypothetical protein
MHIYRFFQQVRILSLIIASVGTMAHETAQPEGSKECSCFCFNYVLIPLSVDLVNNLTILFGLIYLTSGTRPRVAVALSGD